MLRSENPMGLLQKIDHWVDVSAYANACGVANRAIVDRAKRGVITHTMVDGVRLIDMQASPPAKLLSAHATKAPAWQWPDNMPPKTQLVWVWRFASKNGVRSDAIYRAVLYNNINAWGAAGRVLVKRADALQIIGKGS